MVWVFIYKIIIFQFYVIRSATLVFVLPSKPIPVHTGFQIEYERKMLVKIQLHGYSSAFRVFPPRIRDKETNISWRFKIYVKVHSATCFEISRRNNVSPRSSDRLCSAPGGQTGVIGFNNDFSGLGSFCYLNRKLQGTRVPLHNGATLLTIFHGDPSRWYSTFWNRALSTFLVSFSSLQKIMGARGSVVGWGTMLQAGWSRVRFPM
jgi:hypothetical protein